MKVWMTTSPHGLYDLGYKGDTMVTIERGKNVSWSNTLMVYLSSD